MLARNELHSAGSDNKTIIVNFNIVSGCDRHQSEPFRSLLRRYFAIVMILRGTTAMSAGIACKGSCLIEAMPLNAVSNDNKGDARHDDTLS